MKPCDDRIAALAAPDELDAPGRALLERHLGSCAPCRAAAAALRETEALLKSTSFEPDELSALRFAARAANRAEEARDRLAARPRWLPAWPGRPVLALTVLAVLVSAVTAAVVLRAGPGAPVPSDDPGRGREASAHSERSRWTEVLEVDEGWLAALPPDVDAADAADDDAEAWPDDTSLEDALFALDSKEISALNRALDQS